MAAAAAGVMVTTAVTALAMAPTATDIIGPSIVIIKAKVTVTVTIAATSARAALVVAVAVKVKVVRAQKRAVKMAAAAMMRLAFTT